MIADPRRWYRLAAAGLAAARAELDEIRAAFEHAVDALEQREFDLTRCDCPACAEEREA